MISVLLMNTYKITAYVVCHDVRLATYTSTTVQAEKAPAESEAADLLHPVVQEILREYQCEDCQYELITISVDKLP
jgi:hypothetical protein